MNNLCVTLHHFLTGNFDHKILGYILEIWFVHCDAAGGGERVHDAVHAIHCDGLTICSSTLQRKHDLCQCRRQTAPLQDDAGQRVEWPKFLKDVFRCTPDRLGTTTESSHNTVYYFYYYYFYTLRCIVPKG